jgi:hypothetical protein
VIAIIINKKNDNRYRLCKTLSNDELNTIIERIVSETQTATDVEALRVVLSDRRQDLRQLGKYNVNIGQGQDIHIGDRTYVTWNDEALQALIEVVQKLQSTTQTPILRFFISPMGNMSEPSIS